MITLQKLKWDNCFSYGEGNELDLNSTTLTQIIGCLLYTSDAADE